MAEKLSGSRASPGSGVPRSSTYGGTGTSMRGAVSTTPRSRGVGRSRDDASARSRPRDLSPASAARRGLSARGWQAPRLLVRHGSGRGWARGYKSFRTSWKWASRSWLVARVGSGWGWGTLREAWGGPVRPLLPQEKGRQASLASERRYPHVVWTLCPRPLLLPSS